MQQGKFVIWLLAILVSGPTIASCGTAYCTVNTGWDALGVAPKPGWALDLRYEYLKQDTLRAGSKETVPAGEPDTHDELRTLNRNLMATVGYAWDYHWAVSLQVPYLNRDHSHIFNDSVSGSEAESWAISAPGDMRVIAVYQFSAAAHDSTATGIRFGLKLPTGSTTESNAGGERAERTLQPGTGTTDLILGGYRNGGWAQSGMAWFAQAQWQLALNTHDDFRPGSQINLDAGLSRRAGESVNLLLQINSHWRYRDHGAQAEPENSGSRVLLLSPGLAINLGAGGRVYGFVQLPLYQYVNGAQLAADWSVVAGWRQRF